MRWSKCALFALSVATLSLAACGNHSSDEASGGGNPRAIDWAKVPSKFNPNILTDKVDIGGAERVQLDLFGFNDDVRVIYTNTSDQSTAMLSRYIVYYESGTFGSTQSLRNGKTVQVTNYGTYQCQIKTHNGEIESLKGGCYVRVELTLPMGAPVEVYNMGRLLTRRFYAMDNATLLQNVEHGSFGADKLKAIDQFLASYAETGKSAMLNSIELGQVVHQFAFKEDKLNALTKLRGAVHDRENLEMVVVEKEFTYFEQNDARAVLGLPQR
jgi:hypothetical protein